MIKVHHYKCVHSPSTCIRSYASIPVMSSSDALVIIIVLDTGGELYVDSTVESRDQFVPRTHARA